MDFHDVCLLGGILFMIVGVTVFYAGTASLDAWRGDEKNRNLIEKEIFGSLTKHYEARREMLELRRQRWRNEPRVRLAIYFGSLLMLCGAVCLWLR